MYFEGKWIAKDHKLAFKWFLKSAEQGYGNAQFNLSFCTLINFV